MHLFQTELKRLLIALGYFTRVPIPAWVGWSADELNRAARYFPLVGTGVGLFSAAMLLITGQFLPLGLSVTLSMTASILLTGAFHEDGLADSADGFGGGYEPRRVLEIMKDSRIGTFGAIALVLALLTKYVALSETAFHAPLSAVVALVLAHTGSRACALAVMAVLPYVRDDAGAKAKPVAEGVGVAEWGTGIASAVVVFGVAFAFGWSSAAPVGMALLLAIIVTLAAMLYFRRRIGGYTGDCLGATQQITELAIYLAFCVRVA